MPNPETTVQPSGSGRGRNAGVALLGLAGLLVFLSLYRRAFPEAAVTLTVDRAEALGVARAFLEGRGAPPAGFRLAEQFGGDDVAFVLLQRTVGLAEAGRWARERVPIWTWNIRWFSPGKKEEWRVGVGATGRVEQYAHLVEEAAPGADLPQDSALAIATAFLRDQGWDLARFERVESSTQRRDQRTDHHFAWEERGSTIVWHGDSTTGGSGAIRMAVNVQGDVVGGYRHFLKVPEAFSRDLDSTMSVGQLLAYASLGLTFILVLIALGIAITRHRLADIRWRPAFRLAALVAALTIVAGLLSAPVVLYIYPTELPWVAYVGSLVLGLLFVACLYGLWTLFTIASGESLGRETFPEALGGFLDAARGMLLSPHLARASWRGYALGFAFLGYLTGFYLVAQRYLGAWVPAEGPHSQIFNLYLPFLAPLTISLVAAVTEEGTYRLFGIPLVKRYTRSTALALLVPAVIWAFGHSSYAVFPVYLRGIELTIGGLAFGLVFLRYGFLACVVAHFVVDAVQIGMPLLTSGSTSYVVSGWIVMGLALVPAVIGWAARRRTAGPATG